LSEQDDIIESVVAAKARGTFKIIELLADRGYPKQNVVIYMNEDAAYQASVINEKLEDIDSKMVAGKSNTELEKVRDELIAEQEMQMDNIRNSAITIHLVGISEGKREEIYNKSKKKYPIEYEKNQDILRGETKITEKDSPERDSLFTDYIWLEYIDSITDSEGNTEDGLRYDDVRTMRNMLPLAAIAAINQGIEKLRVSTAVFLANTGEDFLAKP
tara:strand:+ start:568 stop:1215 length:648 start_codon:yes stop_codon:yes gene_type:complete